MERVSSSRWFVIFPYPARYAFPSEPRGGVIDLTEDEKPFYFNPYSGELSLVFPKAELKLKGGILAYVFLNIC